MGVSLSYTTTDPVTPEIRKTILADAKQISKKRQWWGEGLHFFTDPKRKGYLTGDTKLYRNLGGDDDDEFMASHDGRFILLTLADWSKKHGISWVVEMAGAELGRIANGKIAPPSLFGANATRKQIQADDERAHKIHAEEADDVKPEASAQTSAKVEQLGEKPKQLQSRWTKDLIARARTALNKSDPNGLKGIFGENAIDGQTYIDCRGFPLQVEAISNLRAAQVDFSYSRFERPLANADLTNCRLVGCNQCDMPISGKYVGCDFTGTNLRNATMTARLHMERCNFTRANCGRGTWELANFHECLFVETNFKAAEWTLSKFTRCSVTNLNLDGAYIAGCSFIEPRQNMKWFDDKTKIEMSHVVREDAAWVDRHGAVTSDMRIK